MKVIKLFENHFFSIRLMNTEELISVTEHTDLTMEELIWEKELGNYLIFQLPSGRFSMCCITESKTKIEFEEFKKLIEQQTQKT